MAIVYQLSLVDEWEQHNIYGYMSGFDEVGKAEMIAPVVRISMQFLEGLLPYSLEKVYQPTNY